MLPPPITNRLQSWRVCLLRRRRSSHHSEEKHSGILPLCRNHQTPICKQSVPLLFFKNVERRVLHSVRHATCGEFQKYNATRRSPASRSYSGPSAGGRAERHKRRGTTTTYGVLSRNDGKLGLVAGAGATTTTGTSTTQHIPARIRSVTRKRRVVLLVLRRGRGNKRSRRNIGSGKDGGTSRGNGTICAGDAGGAASGLWNGFLWNAGGRRS